MLIALIGCGKEKIDGPAPALALYTGALFKAHRAYAEKRGAMIMILSAKYGLIDAAQIIVRYDFRLSDLSKYERDAWNERVLSVLARYPITAELLILAGTDYLGWCPRARQRITDPIGRLPIGLRLRKLKVLNAI